MLCQCQEILESAARNFASSSREVACFRGQFRRIGARPHKAFQFCPAFSAVSTCRKINIHIKLQMFAWSPRFIYGRLITAGQFGESNAGTGSCPLVRANNRHEFDEVAMPKQPDQENRGPGRDPAEYACALDTILKPSPRQKRYPGRISISGILCRHLSRHDWSRLL